MIDVFFAGPLSESEKQELADMIYTIAHWAKMRNQKIKKSMALGDEDIMRLNVALANALSYPDIAIDVLRKFNPKIIDCQSHEARDNQIRAMCYIYCKTIYNDVNEECIKRCEEEAKGFEGDTR